MMYINRSQLKKILIKNNVISQVKDGPTVIFSTSKKFKSINIKRYKSFIIAHYGNFCIHIYYLKELIRN